jgi:hypothetical protein
MATARSLPIAVEPIIKVLVGYCATEEFDEAASSDGI